MGTNPPAPSLRIPDAMKQYADAVVAGLRHEETHDERTYCHECGPVGPLRMGRELRYHPADFAHEPEVLLLGEVMHTLARDLVEVLGLTREQELALRYLGGRIERYRAGKHQRGETIRGTRLTPSTRRALWNTIEAWLREERDR